jgi:hypothetical protein
VVRQWRPYGAGGDSATSTRARPAKRQRPMTARGRRLATRSDIRAATRVGVVAAALCVELNGVDGGSDDAFASRVAADAAPPGAG